MINSYSPGVSTQSGLQQKGSYRGSNGEGGSSPQPHQADPSLREHEKKDPAHTYRISSLLADEPRPIISDGCALCCRGSIRFRIRVCPLPQCRLLLLSGLSLDTAARVGRREPCREGRGGGVLLMPLLPRLLGRGSRSEVARQHQQGDAGSLKWRPQPEPSEKDGSSKRRQSCATRREGGEEEEEEEMERGWGDWWCVCEGGGGSHSRCPSLVGVNL